MEDDNRRDQANTNKKKLKQKPNSYQDTKKVLEQQDTKKVLEQIGSQKTNSNVDQNVELKEQKQSEESLNDYKDKYIRLQAEFANFARQKEQEILSATNFAKNNILLRVLEVIDDIEAYLTQENINEEVKNILSILLAKLNLLITLEGVTVVEINPGDDFDYTIAEVVDTTPSQDESQKGKVAYVIKKCYKIYDKVLRTAKIIVFK